jgi:hypothetical protein
MPPIPTIIVLERSPTQTELSKKPQFRAPPVKGIGELGGKSMNNDVLLMP